MDQCRRDVSDRCSGRVYGDVSQGDGCWTNGLFVVEADNGAFPLSESPPAPSVGKDVKQCSVPIKSRLGV